MGNGAVAPHAAFTKTGHQAQRVVVNPSDTDADVITAFHPESETTRTLLYGSNYVEIQPSTANSNFGATQTFTFANDVDAIGDVWARVKVTVAAVTNNHTIQEMALARVIDRVEVMVGNSTWQTMENSDLLVMAKTALHGPDYERFYLQANGCLESGADLAAAPSAITAGQNKDYIVWVPLTIFNWGGPARSHLTAGAPHQSFRIKLTYAAKEVAQQGNSATAAASALDVSLWARQHVLTNFERDQIRGNTIAKNLRLTQHAEETASTQMNIELDSFSLLASHLLIAVEASGDLAEGATNSILKDAELLLNTSSHSGKLEGSFLATCAGAGMGLEVQDVFDLTATTTAGARRFNLYVFPLASEAYGSDGCPMNRFDTIRLKLNFESAPTAGDKVLVTCVGTASAIYSKQAASLQYHS